MTALESGFDATGLPPALRTLLARLRHGRRRSLGSRRRCAAAQPPATTAAQDGFLPVDESKAQEQLPAAPLVMTAYAVAWAAIFVYVWIAVVAAGGGRARNRGGQPAHGRRGAPLMGNMTSAHFIFIPSVLLVGIVIGWILGGRAARDAYATELKRRERTESCGKRTYGSGFRVQG